MLLSASRLALRTEVRCQLRPLWRNDWRSRLAASRRQSRGVQMAANCATLGTSIPTHSTATPCTKTRLVDLSDRLLSTQHDACYSHRNSLHCQLSLQTVVTSSKQSGLTIAEGADR